MQRRSSNKAAAKVSRNRTGINPRALRLYVLSALVNSLLNLFLHSSGRISSKLTHLADMLVIQPHLPARTVQSESLSKKRGPPPSPQFMVLPSPTTQGERRSRKSQDEPTPKSKQGAQQPAPTPGLTPRMIDPVQSDQDQTPRPTRLQAPPSSARSPSVEVIQSPRPRSQPSSQTSRPHVAPLMLSGTGRANAVASSSGLQDRAMHKEVPSTPEPSQVPNLANQSSSPTGHSSSTPHTSNLFKSSRTNTSLPLQNNSPNDVFGGISRPTSAVKPSTMFSSQTTSSRASPSPSQVSAPISKGGASSSSKASSSTRGTLSRTSRQLRSTSQISQGNSSELEEQGTPPKKMENKKGKGRAEHFENPSAKKKRKVVDSSEDEEEDYSQYTMGAPTEEG